VPTELQKEKERLFNQKIEIEAKVKQIDEGTQTYAGNSHEAKLSMMKRETLKSELSLVMLRIEKVNHKLT